MLAGQMWYIMTSPFPRRVPNSTESCCIVSSCAVQPRYFAASSPGLRGSRRLSGYPRLPRSAQNSSHVKSVFLSVIRQFSRSTGSIRSSAQSTSSLLITNGGAKRTVSLWVSLHNTLRFINASQYRRAPPAWG